MKIVGVMTGTSCDGLDAACVEFKANGWRTLWGRSAKFPAPLRGRVLAAQLPGAKLSLREFGELDRDLGAWFAATLARFCKKNPPDAIASHGQTVAHFPAPKKQGFTIQIGDPTRIAAATGLTVVSNFRDGDMAMGGEGAPLAPRFHRLLAERFAPEGRIAIHNLGGISNLTVISARGETIAFDTGPGNIWIDAATELVTKGQAHFDRDGKLAASTEPDGAAVRKILALDYFQRTPPKSTGRDDFPFELLLRATKVRDRRLVATATAITLESIVGAYRPFKLDGIFFCGGGARNEFLMGQLKNRLAPAQVGPLEDAGLDSQFLEAQAFAYFGYLALQGEPLGGPWTGVKGWAPAAHIIPGRNWPKIVQQLARVAS